MRKREVDKCGCLWLLSCCLPFSFLSGLILRNITASSFAIVCFIEDIAFFDVSLFDEIQFLIKLLVE